MQGLMNRLLCSEIELRFRIFNERLDDYFDWLREESAVPDATLDLKMAILSESGKYVEEAKNHLIALFNMPTGNRRDQFESRIETLREFAVEAHGKMQEHMRMVKVKENR